MTPKCFSGSPNSFNNLKRKWSILNPSSPIKREVWKQINEFPSYEISNFGRVKNTKIGNLLKGRILNGYIQICIKWEGKIYFRYVHTLVLTYFKRPCPPGMEARHLDGIRHHNHLKNLAWGTREENMQDRKRHKIEKFNHPALPYIFSSKLSNSPIKS